MQPVFLDDVWVPMESSASRINTSLPVIDSSRAIARPITPAPMTMQSICSIISRLYGIRGYGESLDIEFTLLGVMFRKNQTGYLNGID